MGFLKDMKKLSKQSKEASKDWDPAAQMREASAALAATSEMMAQQTAAAELAESGEPATAQVNAARDTGTVANLQPVMEIDLLIFAGGRPPYPVTLRQIVPLAQIGRLVPGTRLPVKIDLGDPGAVWIDWRPGPTI
ncbi:hypothetical protein HQ535_01155 [bacterium]|nr:hypothetical protein [bacterium]